MKQHLFVGKVPLDKQLCLWDFVMMVLPFNGSWTSAGLNLEAFLVYLDDVIIFSTSQIQHLDRLEQVLDRRAGLRLRPDRCEILKRSVEFVGHLESADGICAHPNKISAITEWPVPTSVREVRGFLGLCSYYRLFVAQFAEVASPMYALTEKN